MSWTKHFRTVTNPLGQTDAKKSGGMHGTSAKYASVLPEIFAGNPNRIQRYYQFDDMARDSDVAAALDTIADFCTQSEEQSDTPFEIDYHGKADESAVKLLDEALVRWVRKNKFKRILWRIFRDTLKYGDTFFVEDPETNEWYTIDNYSVELVKVSSDGFKKPQEYVIKNFDPNISGRFGTAVSDLSRYHTPGAGSNRSIPTGLSNSAASFQIMGLDNQNKSQQTEQYCAIDAERMVHLSLNELMDQNWPFGCSILEPVFKTFKQKEMLEDAILIYRVQRAPERRIFYIDVGEMNPTLAKMHLEQVKNDIHQRRIPNKSGGGASILDAAYNPLAMMDDYFFAQPLEGRGSRVETLPGGDALGEIGDLTYFTKKMARGLRIPTSYLALGDDEQPAMYNDGKLGQTMIQEFKFTKYCMRIQNLLAPEFDKSFKRYLEKSGISIDPDLFELRLFPPQNFTKYRQIELDLQQTQVYSAVSGEKLLSKRFKLERYLGLTEAEIIRNQELWAEENARKFKQATGASPAESGDQADLSAVGFSGGGGGLGGGFDDMSDFPSDGGIDDMSAPDLEGGDIGGDAPPPEPAGGDIK